MALQQQHQSLEGAIEKYEQILYQKMELVKKLSKIKQKQSKFLKRIQRIEKLTQLIYSIILAIIII